MSANQKNQTRLAHLEEEVAQLQYVLGEHRGECLELIIQNAELEKWVITYSGQSFDRDGKLVNILIYFL